MDTKIFVQNVKKYCAIKGVKPTPACTESGVGRTFIHNVEGGKIPSVEKVQLMAAYLGVTTSDLLGEEIKLGEGDETDLTYRELRYHIDNATPFERQRLLELIKLYKGLEDDAAERRKQKRNSPADGEAVEEVHYHAAECGDPLEPGLYECCGCGETRKFVREQGETLEPCPRCNSYFFLKIT